VIAGVLLWIGADIRSILISGQRKNQLSIEGRWKDLERYFERASKPRRPVVWLFRRYLLPGNITTQHALLLYNQGRPNEALDKVDLAIRQVVKKPKWLGRFYRQATFKSLCGALRSRCLILTGLGRYDEARKVAAQLRIVTGSAAGQNADLALVEFCCGRLDEALAAAESVPPEDTRYDVMRAIAAMAYCMKGRFDEAVQSLDFNPGDVSKYYSPSGLEALSASSAGRKSIELQRRRHAGVFQPARFIRLAEVYIVRGEYHEAVGALDKAEKTIGPEPELQLSYFRHRACSFAALKSSCEAEKFIGRMRGVVQQHPGRSRFWETHFATGQAYYYLSKFSDALEELTSALQFVLHPTEKHVTAYWIALTHEAIGDRGEALRHYQSVAADPIPSWMRKRAAEVLAMQGRQ
jgi:tetratricopeptide (TPR) repeat protein